MKTIKEIKKELGITDLDISQMFGYKNKAAYYSSSARKRIEKGIECLYNAIRA